MRHSSRPLILLLAAIGAACGEEKKLTELPDNGPPPPGVFDYCNEEVNGHAVYVDNEVNRGEVACRRGRAEAAVYGTSITSEFRLKEGDFPKGKIEAAFDDTVSDRVREKFTEARRRDANTPPPVQGTLSVENAKVLARFRTRCPTYFAREAMWTPTELRWVYSNLGPGSHDSGQNWNFEGRYVATGTMPTAVTAIDGDRRGKSYAETQEEATGTPVGELGDSDKFRADAMELQTNPSKNYLNHLLAHEMGHWTFTQMAWEDGRTTTFTSYFAEVTASWIASLCYFNPIERQEYRKWMIERRVYNNELDPVVNPDRNSSDWPSLRPLSEYEEDAPDLKPGRFNNLQYYSAGQDLALLYYAMHELNGPQDPDRLFGITLEAIKKMKGRKMECYNKDWCAGADWFQTIAWPLSKKPLIHTLAEFLGTFEAGLKNEGLFPARLQALWDANKRKMNRFEK